jgi:type IV pilus assembly protein PilM
MGLIPTTLGTRPRLAVEIRPEGVIAARAEDAQAIVSAVAQAAPQGGAAVPVLTGDAALAGRRETIAAVKKALEAVAQKERQTTLVLPDAAVRVLLLEFEQLPTKPVEALAVVRFRL